MNRALSLLNHFDQLFFPRVNVLYNDLENVNKTAFLPINVLEKENSYEVKAELPGFEKENINITIKNGYLKIEAQKEVSNEKEEGKQIIKEYFSNSYSRNVYLADKTTQDINKITAKLENGILFLTIPKKEEEKEKIVKVKID